MRSPFATLLPLLSAFGYTFAALLLKRATESGVGPWRVTFITNWVAGILFLPWWFAGGEPFTLTNLWHACFSGSLFFLGQIFTFLALTRGDVSVTTPVLGTKVIFVALMTVTFEGEHLSRELWIAALLTTMATALLGSERRIAAQRVWRSILLGLVAAACFASTDIIMQKWVKDWGFGRFVPVMFFTIALLSCGLIPLFSAPISAMPKESLRAALAGGAVLTLQANGMAYAISIYREVTTTNILYNTRGMWSVVIVWAIGHWFGNTERNHGTRVMLRRLFGAFLLLLAVFLSLKS